MKRTRLLSAILAALLLTGSFASCADSNDPSDTKEPSQTTSSANDDETKLEDTLPKDLNYKNQEIVFITDDQLSEEKLSGDPVSDAIFERNKAVEQRLGIKITCSGRIISTIMPAAMRRFLSFSIA